MKRVFRLSGKGLILNLCLLICAISGFSQVQAADFSEVEKILGVPGLIQEGAVVFSFPRTDIKVTIDGESMPTALGFTAWTAFTEMDGETMIMGDLVLLETEVNPVISALAAENIQVTALHNHFFGDQPRILFMHISGVGKAENLAKGLRGALGKTATPFGRSGPAGSSPALTIDTKRIEEIP